MAGEGEASTQGGGRWGLRFLTLGWLVLFLLVVAGAVYVWLAPDPPGSAPDSLDTALVIPLPSETAQSETAQSEIDQSTAVSGDYRSGHSRHAGRRGGGPRYGDATDRPAGRRGAARDNAGDHRTAGPRDDPGTVTGNRDGNDQSGHRADRRGTRAAATGPCSPACRDRSRPGRPSPSPSTPPTPGPESPWW